MHDGAAEISPDEDTCWQRVCPGLDYNSWSGLVPLACSRLLSESMSLVRKVISVLMTNKIYDSYQFLSPSVSNGSCSQSSV